MTSTTVGIDDFSVYIPQLYLSISALAERRDTTYAKLNKGLGLEEMAIADAREDTATMAANAVLDLMHKNDLTPEQIGRIYLGTESALDGAQGGAGVATEVFHANRVAVVILDVVLGAPRDE